ncbi:MAG TPA: phosphatidylserine/phosphatidylglycerophosphate/cardiolipin synthase family protein [Thermoanaerobaculia bacterium]
MVLWGTAVLAIVAVLLGYVVWGKSRRRHVDLVIPPNAEIADLLVSFAAFTWGHVVDGNHAEIIQNSAFFDQLVADIERATHHIHIETFLWKDGAVSDRVSEALAARAREGIEVRILVDQRGAKQTNPMVWAELRQAGCDFRVFHRMRFREFAMYNHRDHRKIVVVDGNVAYTFGHGIADMWFGTPDHPRGWRDTAVRVTGPAVREFQTAFFDNWGRSAGTIPAGDRYFPALEPAGTTPMHVAYISQRETTSAVQRLYYFAIAAANHEILLQNPYFLPDKHALWLFRQARQRGVRIRVMLPTASESDFSIVQHATHYHYGALLRMGVHVVEYTRGMHQKVLVVDDLWVCLGSTNFDPRSFRINDEISVAMCDAAIAAELRAAYDDDARYCEEWTMERWKSRSWKHAAWDWFASRLKREL